MHIQSTDAGTGQRFRTRMEILATLLLSVFVLWTAATGVLSPLIQRPVFLNLVIIAVLLRYPLWAGSRFSFVGNAIDTVMALGVTGSCLWVVFNSASIMDTMPVATSMHIAMATILVVTIMELSRRVIGILFPLLVVIGILYTLYGHSLPGMLGHAPFDISFVVETLLLGDVGLWGSLLGVAASLISVFILFGAFLLHTGGAAVFMDLALRIGGRSEGGAAKIATIASGLFGMVSGSAVANVATTGAFTIPLMKRLKYPAAFAGAVEAVASTGGQLAPPIMGAAAFIMAELIGVSYIYIAIAAILPAVAYYLAIFVAIHVIAQKHHLGLVPLEQIPAWRSILLVHRLAPLLLALGALTVGILLGKSLETSAFYGICGAIAGSAVKLRAGQRISGSSETGDPAIWPSARCQSASPAASRIRQMVGAIGESLKEGASGLLIVGILLAGAQILVSLINLTGVGIALSSLLVNLGDNNIYGLAVVVAGVCMVLGMGVPTTAAYVLVAATIAPSLIALGVKPIVTHMFVFYYATLSAITPPVCVAVFVAASIANVGWLKVARYAVGLAGAIYLVPFYFLAMPEALEPHLTIGFAAVVLRVVMGTTAMACLINNAEVSRFWIINVLGWGLSCVLAFLGGHEFVIANILLLGGMLYAYSRRRGSLNVAPPGELPATAPVSSTEVD